MRRIFNFGIEETTPVHEKVVIKLSNQIGVFEFVACVIVIFAFWELFQVIFLVPVLAALGGLLVLGLNSMHLLKLSRVILIVVSVICWAAASAYLTPAGEKPMVGLTALLIAFSASPFILFTSRERVLQVVLFLFSVLPVIFTNSINRFFEIDDLSSNTSSDTFEFAALSGAVVLLFMLGSGLFSGMRSVVQENQELKREVDERGEKLRRQKETMERSLAELEEARKEDQTRNWISKGVAEIGQILHATTDYDEMYGRLITKVVKYVKANQGGLFLYNEKENCLELTSMYAFDRKKYIEKKIGVREGLLGQAFMEKDIVYLKKVPPNYVKITSGLGDETPTVLIIAPMIANDKVEAVIELAFFHELRDHELEFIKRIGEEIAISIANSSLNLSTRKLLEQSQQQAEDLRAQEEEMRQNLEELEATQEEMARTQKELADQQANLSALINNTDDSIATIDRDYKVLVVNQKLKDRYKGTQYEGIDAGFSMLEMLGDVRDEWKGYYDRVFDGEKLNFVIESSVRGENSWREYFLNPIKNENGVIIGLSILSRDVTGMHQIRIDLEEKEKLLENIIDNIDDAFFAIDKDYKIKAANRVLRERYLQSGIELKPGCNILEVFNDEQMDFWAPKYERILSGEGFAFEMERPVDGKNLYLEIHCMPLKNEEGEVIGGTVLSKDITHLKEKLTGNMA